jgi:hypothetical protein
MTKRSEKIRPLLLFAIALLIYAAPLAYNALVKPFFHAVPSQDVVSASLVPTSILTRGNFYLDQYRRYIANNYPEPSFAVEINNHLVSRTPIVAGVLALPFIGWGYGSGGIERTPNVFDFAKFSAAFIVAASVLAFYFCAITLTDAQTSMLVAVAFAFGSAIWSTASQGLWQHTPSVLFQSIAFWFILRGLRQGGNKIAPAGIFFSLATISRPSNILTALIFTLFIFIHFRQSLPRFIIWALPPLALVLIYNFAINGAPLIFGYQEGEWQRFGIPNPEAIQGLLFSPSRGLFVFSPFLLLAPLGLWFGWIREKKFFYAYLALVSVVYTTIMASWGSLGGWAYGSRMLTDTLPAMCLLIIPAVERIKGNWRAVLWGIVFLAAFVQTLGLEDYGVRFHSDPTNSVWSVENNEPLFYLRFYISSIQDMLGL